VQESNLKVISARVVFMPPAWAAFLLTKKKGEMVMTFMVQLDVHRGACDSPSMSLNAAVDAESPLSALSVAERKLNTCLADDTYCAARRVYPIVEPRQAPASMALAAA